MNKFKNITIKYENMTIEECLDFYNKNVCCVADGDNRFLRFEEEK